MTHWRSRNIENVLKGYKMDLGAAIGSKVPASILNFFFKHTYCRKVSSSLENYQGYGSGSDPDPEGQK
jgi:hypothetical protein